MATLRIVVNFTPCVPDPDNGYRFYYREYGTGGPYIDGGTFATSPAIIETNNAPGTQYEGYFFSQCDSGNGDHVPFSTYTPPPQICKEYYNNTSAVLHNVSYTACDGTLVDRVDVNPGQSICIQDGTLSGGDSGFLILLGDC